MGVLVGALDEGPQDQDEYATWQAEGHALVDRLRGELSQHRYEVVADF